MIKKWLIPYYVSFLETKKNCDLPKKKELLAPGLEAEIIRHLHSIEKGLCLESPRLGFGAAKMGDLFNLINNYLALGDQDPHCLYMARDALQAYMDFHAANNFTNADVERVGEQLASLKAIIGEGDGNFGGFRTLDTDEFDFTTEQVENLFQTRHSVREFSGKPVTGEEIEKAIALAQMSPSACNRQCSRVYFVDKRKFMAEMNTDLQGIGGFADDACGFLLVTGRKSAYQPGERHQYIVSASMFAGYLSLALHTYGIAACTVQRSVSPNPLWDNFKKINDIPEDEQIVVMFAIGKYKKETKVPISKRFPVQKIYRELK